MKNKITTIVLCILTNTLFAQENITFFQVNDLTCVLSENFGASTAIEYYSENNGGANLGALQINTGNLFTTFPAKNAPKMFINRKTISNPNGSNMVYFLEDKEFWLHNVLQQVNATNCIISWQATVFNNNQISYRILQSIDGVDFKEVAIMNAKNNLLDNSYEYFSSVIPNAIYKIEVINSKQNKIRYTTPTIAISAIKGFANIYPTQCTNQINVALLTEFKNDVFYQIFNTNGKLIFTNRLLQSNSVINISSLKSGNYIMDLWINDVRESYKFIKE